LWATRITQPVDLRSAVIELRKRLIAAKTCQQNASSAVQRCTDQPHFFDSTLRHVPADACGEFDQ
jgi:hypothetical protein